MLRELFVFALLGALSAPATAEEIAGTIREVGGAGRSVVELKTEEGETLSLRAKSSQDEVELKNLGTLKVKLVGERDKQGLLVERYEILETGPEGQKPRLGLLASLLVAGEARMIFVDERGQAELLPSGFSSKTKALVGAKVWMIGLKKGDRYTPLRFGVLRAPAASAAP